MKKVPFLLFLTLGLFLASCQNKTTTETTTSAPTDQAENTSDLPPALNEIEVKLGCREIHSAEEEIPLSEILLTVNGTTIVVDSATACGDITPDMWENYKIPKNAKAAVGGWFAGAGDYYYLMLEGPEAVVMYGWADEGADEKDMYQYKEVARTPLGPGLMK